MDNNDTNTKLLIAIGVVLFLMIIACSVLIIHLNKDDKQDVKTQEKRDSDKKEEKKKEEPKKEEKKEEPKDKEKRNTGEGKVPDLTGLTVEEAVEVLNGAHISSKYSLKRIDSDKPKDTIVKTEPEAGAEIGEEALEITFYLSRGPKE
jgi:beta-lactam-binding protein with PASTA domain